MKLIIRNIKTIVILLICLGPGCDTQDLHNLNKNPNAFQTLDLNYFFTAVELGSASSGSYYPVEANLTDWANVEICAHAIQQLANTEPPESFSAGDKYIEKSDILSQTFSPFKIFYRDVAQNCAEIIRQTGPGGFDEGNKVNMRNATRILRVLCFHRLTDWYGSIPYFEANKGTERIFNPKYDKQKDIYADLLHELDDATATLNSLNPDEGFATADFIYNGDVEKWKRFGHSLMLRLAMRISDVDAATSATYVSKAVAGDVFQGNDDNVWIAMAAGPVKEKNQNGISRFFDPGDLNMKSYLSKTLIDYLMGADKTNIADDDPRLMIFSGGIAKWTTENWIVLPGGDDPLNQKGLPNGLDQSMLNAIEGHPVDQDSIYSRVNFKMLQVDDPYPVMNYAEVQFLMAEALERGIGSGINGTAKSHYEEGVKAACQMWTPYDPTLVVADSVIETYLSLYPYAVAKPALEMIGEQLWLSKWMNWWEAWSDWRRTGYPKLIPVNYPGNDTNGQIPTKLIIPESEVALNPNYKTGATQPDHFTGKVWWDGGPE